MYFVPGLASWQCKRNASLRCYACSQAPPAASRPPGGGGVVGGVEGSLRMASLPPPRLNTSRRAVQLKSYQAPDGRSLGLDPDTGRCGGGGEVDNSFLQGPGM